MAEPRAFTLTVAGLTDVGKKRQRNEDSLRWVVPTPGSPEAVHGAALLVCDGMGGVGQGDIASQTAVERFFSVYYDLTYIEPDTQKRVQRALEIAHEAVREAAARLSRLYIGTTAAGFVIKNDGSVLVFSLGDSRVYRLRGDTFTQVSKDQSVNAALLERGDITPEQALEARNNNITMFIGHPLEMVPFYAHLTLEPGDLYLTCSDGLWDVVREKQLREILLAQAPQQAVRTMVDQTLRNGAPDNVSVIIASTRSYAASRRWWPLALLLLLIIGGGAAVFASQSRQPEGGTDTPVAIADAATDVIASATAEPPTAEPEASEPPITGDQPAIPLGMSNVQVLPSDTPPPSATASDTPPPSHTPTETATETTTPQPTVTGTATETATRRPTRTPLPTNTPTITNTPSPTTTNRATRTPSATRTETPTITSTFTATNTPTDTVTPTITNTPSPHPTKTPTDTPPPSQTPTGTLPPTATNTATATSTSNPEFWALLGTPTAALELVAVKQFNDPRQPPIEIYAGSIERRFTSVTQPDPLDPGAKYTLVYLHANILAGNRFWWLLEDVQPQFEVLDEDGIRVYATASTLAARRASIGVGELVIVTGISPDKRWFRIRSRQGDGWVNAQVLDDGLVRFLGDIDDVPTVSPPPLTQPTTAQEATAEPEQPTAQPNDPQPEQPQPTPVPAQPTNPPAPTDVPVEPPTPEPPTPEPPTPVPPTDGPPPGGRPPTEEP